MATVKTNTDVFEKAWEGFKGTDWKEKASVSRFVQANYTPYDGDESFLAGPTERSLKIKLARSSHCRCRSLSALHDRRILLFAEG